MKDQVFRQQVTVDPNQADNRLDKKFCKRGGYMAFLRKFAEGTDPTKYQFAAGATLVPLTDMDGDVPGVTNPYGAIVPGMRHEGAKLEATAPVSLAILERNLVERLGPRRKPVTDEEEVAEAMETFRQPETPPESQELAADVQRILDAEQLVVQPPPLTVPPLAAPIATATAARPEPEIMVEAKGAFGRARLPCVAVEADEDTVALVQRDTSFGLDIPASDQPCRLTWDKQSIEAFPTGICIRLTALGLQVQVFLKQQ